MQYYPLEEVLAAEYLLEDFRPDLIEMVLDKLRPEYVRSVLTNWSRKEKLSLSKVRAAENDLSKLILLLAVFIHKKSYIKLLIITAISTLKIICFMFGFQLSVEERKSQTALQI